MISADPDEPGLDTVFDFIGDDNLVWNTDYPHLDAPDPNQVLPWFSAQPISEDSKRKILWDKRGQTLRFSLAGERAVEIEWVVCSCTDDSLCRKLVAERLVRFAKVIRQRDRYRGSRLRLLPPPLSGSTIAHPSVAWLRFAVSA